MHSGGQLLNLARAESAQVRPILALSAAQAWCNFLSAEVHLDSDGDADPWASHSGAVGNETGDRAELWLVSSQVTCSVHLIWYCILHWKGWDCILHWKGRDCILHWKGWDSILHWKGMSDMIV